MRALAAAIAITGLAAAGVLFVTLRPQPGAPPVPPVPPAASSLEDQVAAALQEVAGEARVANAAVVLFEVDHDELSAGNLVLRVHRSALPLHPVHPISHAGNLARIQSVIAVSTSTRFVSPMTA